MTVTATSDGKLAPSGRDVPAADMVKGVIATKKVRVKCATGERGHRFAEGPSGRVPWYSQAPLCKRIKHEGQPDELRPTVPGWTWGEDPMHKGPNEKSISAVGCGLTSVAMILSYFGYKVTPGDLNIYAQNNGIYASDSNCIHDWDALFRYGGANLSFSRGLPKNKRYLDADQAKDPGMRRALFNIARAQLEKGLPCIGRVDYNDLKHTSWGDHFIVLVGIHQDGHLLINDPGRFCPGHLEIGNGAMHPDVSDNYIGESLWTMDAQPIGTEKNGGYKLMRIDIVEGNHGSVVSVPATAPVDNPPTDAKFQAWAHGEVTKHVDSFSDRLLAAARTVIVAQIKAALAGQSAAKYTFELASINLLVK